jgi:hypothetical protein
VDRLVPAAIVVLVIALVLMAMYLGWRSRTRRQVDISVPASAPTGLGAALHRSEALHAATTIADTPLERVTVGPLAFRARATVSVHDDGVLLEPRGEDAVFVPAGDIVSVERATWTIDKGVETGGLICLRWRLGDTEVDTYLRAAADSGLLEAIASVLEREN